MTQNPLPPSGPPLKLEYLKGFSFFYRDANFTNNLLLGSVHMLIPIVGPIVLLGWYCEIIQRLVRRHPRPIPKLDFGDFTHYLGRGLVPFVVQLIVTLPLMIAIYAAFFLGAFAVALLARQGIQDYTLIGIGLIGGIAAFFLIILPASVFIFTMATFAELTEDFGQSLNFSLIMGYAKRNWKAIVTAQLVFIPITMLMMVAGVAMCFLGIYLVTVFVNFAYLHLRWQIYELNLQQGGPSLVLKAQQILPSEQRAAMPPQAPASPPPPPPPAPPA